MKLIIETNTDPRRNLAREEVLLDCCREEVLYLWRNGPSVIVGRHQNTLAEVDEEAARAEGIQIVRRLTGGGAVYHDLGNINFSYIFPKGDFEEKRNAGVVMMTDFLKTLGADSYPSGRNDICMQAEEGAEVKISGTAMTQRGEGGIFHGCVLFDCDLSRLAKVLTPSREKLQSKGIASVRSRVANLKTMSDVCSRMTADQFFDTWAAYLQKNCTVADSLCEEEEERIQQLIQSRYGNRQWNFGRNPLCSVENSYRFPVGTVELHLETKGENIQECRFTGDFITPADFSVLEEALKGIAFTEEGIKQAISGLNLHAYFGIDNRDQVIEFFMGKRI